MSGRDAGGGEDRKSNNRGIVSIHIGHDCLSCCFTLEWWTLPECVNVPQCHLTNVHNKKERSARSVRVMSHRNRNSQSSIYLKRFFFFNTQPLLKLSQDLLKRY